MRDGITRIIRGNLDLDPPCFSASVREECIGPGDPPNAAPPRRWPHGSADTPHTLQDLKQEQ